MARGGVSLDSSGVVLPPEERNGFGIFIVFGASVLVVVRIAVTGDTRFPSAVRTHQSFILQGGYVLQTHPRLTRGLLEAVPLTSPGGFWKRFAAKGGQLVSAMEK